MEDCRRRWRTAVIGGRWKTVEDGGGRWIRFVMHWWTQVNGGGRWWTVVDGDGRWRTVEDVGGGGGVWIFIDSH